VAVTQRAAGQKAVVLEEELSMREVRTERAPRPAGHYAQAVVHRGVVYVSGQLPVDPHTGERRLGSIEEQTSQALENVTHILEAAGSGLDRVLKTTVYIVDISLWDRVNAVYARFFGEHHPARAVVPTRELHHGFQVEIEAIAAVKEGDG
jgi:2-iminobutanoate/2-iminopropanoate deaminase